MTRYTIDNDGRLHLPDGPAVKDDLYLGRTAIKFLPEGLTVGGSLDLNSTEITSLPKGLTVGGGLHLSRTPIKSLPEGLTVGGDLDLRGTTIAALPEGLIVGGNLYLSSTAIKSLPEGLAVSGSLILWDTKITSLPKGLIVGGNLHLSSTPIKSLPEGLTVGGDLNLRGTAIAALPESIRLGGHTIADAPRINNIHKAVLAAVEGGERLDMADWHSPCGTTHCCAGWAVVLAGAAGGALEAKIGTANAAYLIYAASDPERPVIDFYASDADALADMRARAEREAACSGLIAGETQAACPSSLVSAHLPRIVAVAVRANGLTISMPRPARHSHILHALPTQLACSAEQGFLANDGRFVDRTEALAIARNAGQLLRPTSLPELYSEDLKAELHHLEREFSLTGVTSEYDL